MRGQGHQRLGIASTSVLVLMLVAAQYGLASGKKEVQGKVVYASMFSVGEPSMQVLDKAAKDFMAQNPAVTVEVQWDSRQVLTQLQSAIAASTQVDIVDQSDDRIYNAVVLNDLAQPLDQYLAEKAYGSSTTWKDTYLPGAFDQLKGRDGKIYMLPRDDSISSFFYNVKLLAEVGIQPKALGTTWDEFLGYLETIKTKKPGVAPLGADGNIPFYNNWYFSYLAIRVAGQDAFRAAAYDKTGEKWGQPEFLQAAKMVRELIDKGYFQPHYEGSVWPAAQVDWVNGKIGMIFCGGWLPKEMSEQSPADFQTDLFAFPNVAGGKGNNLVEHWSNVYAVLKSAKDMQATILFLKYLGSAKVGSEFAAMGSTVPIHGVEVPAVLKNQYEVMKKYGQMAAIAGLNTELPNYMEKVYNPIDDKLFQGQVPPEEFIRLLRDGTKQYWATAQ
jgi:ABC-type glycerol-3-phosphate transport system substrate-binding protein